MLVFSVDRALTDRKFKRPFRPTLPVARLRRRPPRAGGHGGGPSAQRLLAAAVRRQAWRGNARAGQAAQRA
jgi:hypothetical protein